MWSHFYRLDWHWHFKMHVFQEWFEIPLESRYVDADTFRDFELMAIGGGEL